MKNQKDKIDSLYPKVCVLMTTYNGGKYLRQQIDSILTQTKVNPVIYIRDDKSSDETISIINSYEGDRVTLVKDADHLGPGEGFMRLLYESTEYPYYAFADQDDIWKENKLSEAIKKLSGINEPALYCSNQTIYKNGKEQELRFNRISNYSTAELICGNHIAGCTMVMNKALRDVLISKPGIPSKELLNIRMHDVWVLLVADLCGTIVYDDRSFIDYRIHENNTVGVKSLSLKERINRAIKKIKSSNTNGREKISRELLKGNYPIKDKQKERIVKEFANYRNSFSDKMKLMKDKNIKSECSENNLFFDIKTIIGWH